MNDRVARRLVLAVLSATCSSCLVGPNYTPPTPAVPAGWYAPMDNGLVADAGAEYDSVDRAWWRTLDDPVLDRLVSLAVSSNLDVRRAIARVRVARAARREQQAAFFPPVDASSGYERRRSPSVSNRSTSNSDDSFGGRDFDDFSAGFDATWELDLFGGIRRANERAEAELEASDADLRSTLVSVVAEVARNYVDVRSLQARVEIAKSNAESQRGTLDIVTWRHKAGLANALDVEQAAYNLAETRSRIPVLTADLARARNRIAVLVGSNPGSYDDVLEARRPVPRVPARVAVGLPADLVRRRPDVAAAERRLAAATAAIGIATADLYPHLSLSGTFSVAASDFASLDSAAARGYSIGPAIRWNVFDAGRLRSIIAQRSAEADLALDDWIAAALAAGEETENALVQFATEQERRDRLVEARAAAHRAHDLARVQYENGLVDFERVLEAERAALVFEQSVAESEANVVNNLVALYKALGGGWQVVECDDERCEEALL